MIIKKNVIYARNEEGNLEPLENLLVGQQDTISADKVTDLAMVAKTGRYEHLIGAPDPNDLIVDAGIEVGDVEPERTSIDVWIDTNENQTTYRIPEVKDNVVNTTDTWSSSKIQSEIALNASGLQDFSTLINLIYPVGSIYTSANPTNPSTLFGGTWVQIKGRFLLTADDETYIAGNEGGEAEVQLTIDEMPRHNHIVIFGEYEVTHNIGANGTYWDNVGITSNNTTGNVTADYKGGDQPHNNMPPYLVVYAWQRTE